MQAELYLTYAIDAKGNLVHIDNVPNGQACGCFCPNCKNALIVKNEGKHNVHHFAHMGGADCVGAYESALHIMAKEILRTSKKVMMPQYPNSINGIRAFKRVELECYNKVLSLRPDCVGYNEDDVPLWIEFKRSHEVDSDKAEKIKRAKFECIEIDVNQCLLDPSALRKFIEESYENRRWIYYKGEENVVSTIAQTSNSTQHSVLQRLNKKSCQQSFTNEYLTSWLPKVVDTERQRHFVVNEEGRFLNLYDLVGHVSFISNSFRCIYCKNKVRLTSSNNGHPFFVHSTGEESRCSFKQYLKEAAKEVVCNNFDNSRKFYIYPFGKPIDIKQYKYNKCISSNLEFGDLALVRNGKIDECTIYIYFDVGENTDLIREKSSRSIIIHVDSEYYILKELMNNSEQGVEYRGFRITGEIPIFSLYENGKYEYKIRNISYQPSESVVYEIRFLSRSKNPADDELFAIIKCLEADKTVQRCKVCRKMDCCQFIEKKGTDCLWFELDKLIKVRIEVDYGAVRYEEKEYSPSKEGSLW